MKNYFKDLDFSGWSGKTIILDIDGTITTDGSSEIESAVLNKVQELGKNNSVFLFSNKHLINRNNEVAKKLNIPLLKSSFKKPNKKVINNIPENLKNNLVVMGDKILTDGLFAKNIKAEFVKVKRLTSKDSSLKIKLIYLLDDVVGCFLN